MNGHKFISGVIAGLLYLLCIGLAVAAPPVVKVDIPDSIPGTTLVDAEGVVKLATANSKLVIIDARIEGDRKHGFIEGSVSLPDIITNCAALAKVISRKSTPALFYCNGVSCGRSVISSRIALKCGYTNVYWFRGGFEEWASMNYPVILK